MNLSEIDTDGTETNKLNESSFQIWKQKMELVLMLRRAQIVITIRNLLHSGTADYDEWTQKNKVAYGIVGLSFSMKVILCNLQSFPRVQSSQETNEI